MSKGKGALDRLMLVVKKGQIIFEINLKQNISEYDVIKLLQQCMYKLPIKTKIFLSQY